MAALGTLFSFIGRIGLSLIFILAGVGKLMNPADTNAMIQNNPYVAGLGFTPLAFGVGLFELIAGLFILVGFLTRLTSLVLAGFCIVTALFFHNQLGDPMQQANFLKNIAIAGGFLVLFAYGNTRASLDGVRAAKRDALQRERVATAERDVARDRDTVVVERDPVVVDRGPVTAGRESVVTDRGTVVTDDGGTPRRT